MCAPWAKVPLPGGKPAPSGMMLMSHAAISAGSTGLPRCGPSANAALKPSASAKAPAAIGSLCVNMFDLSLAVDRPTRDAVEVLVREGQYGRYRLPLTK